MQRTVIGVFDSHDQVERAVNDLKERGFNEREISIVAREDNGQGGNEGGNQGGMMGNGSEVRSGVATGGAIGGVAGLLAGAGALAIPGIGPILAAGPLAAALSGAVTGGIAGGLIDFGIPEERGRHFEQRLREGRLLGLVKCDANRADQAERIFRDNGAREVELHEASR